MKRRLIGAAALLVAALLIASPARTPAAPPEPTESLTVPTTLRAVTPPVVTPPPAISTPEPEETPIEEPSRYSGIELTDDDLETLARLVWLEARGEPFDGQRAVVEVVLNRILSPSFPDTVEEVVYQRNQFSPAAYIAGTTPTEAQYEAVAAAVEGIDPITDADVVFFSVGAYNDKVFATIGNHVFCRE